MRRLAVAALLACLAGANAAAQPMTKAQMSQKLKDLEAKHKADVANAEQARKDVHDKADGAIKELEAKLKELRERLAADMTASEEKLHALRDQFWRERDPLVDQLDPNGAGKRHAQEDAIRRADSLEKAEMKDLSDREKAEVDAVREKYKQARDAARKKYSQMRKVP